MIDYYKKPFTAEESLSALNPVLRAWFEKKYKGLTPPQRYSFRLIKEEKNLLITAPTGSGKTFSAFMSILSSLFGMAQDGTLEDKIYCIYISPLKALNNDIYKNLNVPLDDVYSTPKAEGLKRISVGVRTGDTPQSERQKQLRTPPNILVTTPETLAIILNSPRFIENLKDIKYVVIDELHELANNKRGVHLSLSLERLTEYLERDFVRIGLGATLYPLEEAAKFLVGYKNEKEERDCYIVDATWDKKMDYQVMCPVKDIINASNDQIDKEIYKTLNSVIKKNETTLIFTNTRSGTERTVFNLTRRFRYGEESVAAHHGSLSRESRLEVEELLKKGKLKCVVSSTSLELGIDIGTIDDVVQLGSPKSMTRAIQRIGRSGHSFNDVARGQIIVINRDDLVECSVMLYEAKRRHLDSFTTPMNALDVLSQHIVGMSLNKKWKIDHAYETVRKAYPYHGLDRKDFDRTINYLAGAYVGLESRRVYGKIWAEEGEFGRRGRFTKLIYYLNLGTIPDTVSVQVYEKSRWIGGIQEEFLARLKPGDIFVLGGRLYRFDYSKGMNCYVSRADARMPTIPPWFSEQLPLTYELAIDIGNFRERFGEAVRRSVKNSKSVFSMLKKNRLEPNEDAKRILDEMPIDANAKHSIFQYFAEQLLFAGIIPNDRLILIEKTADKEKKRNMIIFHTLYGRRVNDALSRVLAVLLGDIHETDIGVAINDNGFMLVTESDVKIKKDEINELVQELVSADIAAMLRDNVRRTEMLKRRFRQCAARAFMILRNYKGRQISVNRQQVNSGMLLGSVEEIGRDFPVLKETYREVLEDVMDLKRTKEIIARIKKGEIDYRVIETSAPSPFSHVLITFGEADVVMMKDRRKRLRELHKQVLDQIKRYSR